MATLPLESEQTTRLHVCLCVLVCLIVHLHIQCSEQDRVHVRLATVHSLTLDLALLPDWKTPSDVNLAGGSVSPHPCSVGHITSIVLKVSDLMWRYPEICSEIVKRIDWFALAQNVWRVSSLRPRGFISGPEVHLKWLLFTHVCKKVNLSQVKAVYFAQLKIITVSQRGFLKTYGHRVMFVLTFMWKLSLGVKYEFESQSCFSMKWTMKQGRLKPSVHLHGSFGEEATSCFQ